MSISSSVHRPSPASPPSATAQRRAANLQERASDERTTEQVPANLEPHWSAAIDAATD